MSRSAAAFSLSYKNKILQLHLQQSLFCPLTHVLATRGILKSAIYRFTNTHTLAFHLGFKWSKKHKPSQSVTENKYMQNEQAGPAFKTSHYGPDFRNGIQEAGCQQVSRHRGHTSTFKDKLENRSLVNQFGYYSFIKVWLCSNRFIGACSAAFCYNNALRNAMKSDFKI